MPEAGPFGETFFEARALAITAGLLLKRPSSGWVESVSTFADHFFFVAILTSEESLLRIHRMRVEGTFSSAHQKKIAQHPTALLSENSGRKFGAVVELWMVYDSENAAAGSGLGIVGGVDESCNAPVQDGAGAHGAGFERDVEGAAAFRSEQAIV